ncbi:MAG: alpha/beta hydrolase [Chloroflexi bacterium]|nr:alpha/beta hydrolase [Chloroflexota bacterium]
MKGRYRLFKTGHIAAFPVRLAVIMLCVAQSLGSGLIVGASPLQVKELNFVFLHGMGSTSAPTQLLADTIEERARTYISDFQQANPGTIVQINTLQRSYPNDVDIDKWAQNIADAVEKHFAGKKNLILVGHSMGGKAALYAVAHNIGNLSDRTAMVVTINSPIKYLNAYNVVGGVSVTNYIQANRLISDKGVANSLSSYDSSADGLQVGTNKHWLAFISAESAPLSTQFDFSSLDPFPEDMDDGLVPISAQYSAGADVVYYGEHAHSAFTEEPDVAETIADQILRYLFGGIIETPVLAYSQTFEHHAGWFPLAYHWGDRLGESLGMSGDISHINSSFFKWQEWEDIVGGCSTGNLLSSYQVYLDSFPFLTSTNIRLSNPGDPTDCRLYVKTRAAPKSRVQARWNTLQYQTLPPEVNRDHYEIKITGGTSLVKIPQASWLTSNTTDTRLQAWSQAEGPFRWFKADVQIYSQQAVRRKLIDEILSQPLAGYNQ